MNSFELFVNILIATSLFVYGEKPPNFCKTLNGGVGRCILAEVCRQFNSNGNLTSCYPEEKGDFVCCPAMERIVTPVDGNPVAVPPPQSIVPVPIIEFTTQPPLPVYSEFTTQTNLISVSIASSKCEEYKHRVIKRASIITYVFGGTDSLSKEFPHMAALGYGDSNNPEWLCGGSLISEQYVLTAAHCLLTSNLGELRVVRLGDLDLQSTLDDADPQDVPIEQKIPHPAYVPPSQYNDIALLKLARPVQLNEYISPICLETTTNLPNTNFIATGWGRTELGGPQSDTLQKVDLQYFSNDICRQDYAAISPQSLPQGILDQSQICAGSQTEEKDTCQGDSGGPLQIRDDVLYLVGITSFGMACGVPNSPGVYTRASYFIPWIQPIVWP